MQENLESQKDLVRRIKDHHLKLTYVPALDGIRAAVFAVMLVHLEQVAPVLSGNPLLKHLLYDRTWFVLDIYFCLSGFLITWLLCSELHATGNIDLLRFHKRRALRLTPAYVTAITIAIFLAGMHGFSLGQIAHDLVYFVTYTYNIFYSMYGWSIAPALGLFLVPLWSLCVEEQFYFAWSLAFRRLKLARALPAVIWTIGALWVYQIVVILWMRHTGHSFSEIFDRLYFASSARMDAILFGCAAALALQNRRYYNLAQKYLTRKSITFVLPVAIAAIIFLTARRGVASLGFQLYSSSIAFTLLAAWIVAIFLQPKSRVSRFFASRPLVYIGKISYGIYLFHYIVIRIVAHELGVGAGLKPVTHNLLVWLVVAISSVLLATTHYYAIERPLLNAYRSSIKSGSRPQLQPQLAPHPLAERPAFARHANHAA